MTLSDFLSPGKVDRSNPHGIIAISFNLQEVLETKCYMHTRSEA